MSRRQRTSEAGSAHVTSASNSVSGGGTGVGGASGGGQGGGVHRAVPSDARHQYVLKKVCDMLGIEGDIESHASRDYLVYQIGSFLEEGGPRKLLFYFQARERRELRDAGGGQISLEAPSGTVVASASSMSVAGDGGEAPPLPPPKRSGRRLFISTGDTVPLVGKCAYVLRLHDRALTAASMDSDVVIGVLGENLLAELQGTLQAVFRPVLDRTRRDWQIGAVDDPGASAFLKGLESFVATLGEMETTLGAAFDLEMPRGADKIAAQPDGVTKAARDPAVVRRFSDTLTGWVRQIEHVIMESDQIRVESDEVGPNAELEQWKERMARFTKLTEQLKDPACKAVLGVLAAAKAPALKTWKNLDIRITDAANEAKDNVKYLYTLQKFSEPLYRDDPADIVDSIPGLINGIKMMHSISRYYNTSERMTALFIKITNQMIMCCKRYIREGGEVWRQTAGGFRERYESCVRLNREYQDYFRKTKLAMRAIPSGKQFNFSEVYIFGKFDVFCAHLRRLLDMMEVREGFGFVYGCRVEGMAKIVRQFDSIKQVIEARPYEPLDHRNPQFEKDFANFMRQMGELEATLREFIDRSFAEAPTTSHALELLSAFSGALERESMRDGYDEKVLHILCGFEAELDLVRDLYEAGKDAPPIARNLPPVAGAIAWARQLLRRIETPMAKLSAVRGFAKAAQSAKGVVKAYNRTAQALIKYETLWHDGWAGAVREARAGLHATLLVRQQSTGALFVNFDPTLLRLLRDTEAMASMGLEVPPDALAVARQSTALKNIRNRLALMVAEHERVVGKIRPELRAIAWRHADVLAGYVEPGLTTLTWTSLNVDGYIDTVFRCLAQLEELVDKINDVAATRIDSLLERIAATRVVTLPADGPASIANLPATTAEHALHQAHFLESANNAVETAVQDLVAMCTVGYTQEEEERISGEIYALMEHQDRQLFAAITQCLKGSFSLIRVRLRAPGAPLITAAGAASPAMMAGAGAGAGGAAGRSGSGLAAANASPSGSNQMVVGGGDGVDPLISGSVGPLAGPGKPTPLSSLGPLAAHDEPPLFEVTVEVYNGVFLFNPSLDDIDRCLALTGQEIIGVSKHLVSWGQDREALESDDEDDAMEGGADADKSGYTAAGDTSVGGGDADPQSSTETYAEFSERKRRAGRMGDVTRAKLNSSGPDAAANEAAAAAMVAEQMQIGTEFKRRTASKLTTLYPEISAHPEMVRAVLYMVGNLRTVTDELEAHLAGLARRHLWLWSDSIADRFASIQSRDPSLSEWQSELQRLADVEKELHALPQHTDVLGVRVLHAELRKLGAQRAAEWRQQLGGMFIAAPRKELFELVEFIDQRHAELSREVEDLDDIRMIMRALVAVREKNAIADYAIGPILESYSLLRRFDIEVSKNELDVVDNLVYSWEKLKSKSQEASNKLGEVQGKYRDGLLTSVKSFRAEVDEFVRSYNESGPMVPGLKPQKAAERLKLFQMQFEDRKRKWELYAAGEALFGFPETDYPELMRIKKELNLLDHLYSLYLDVSITVGGYDDILWADADFEAITTQITEFQARCRRLPQALRGWPAFQALRQIIDDFVDAMPVLELLAHPAVLPRHWEQLADITGHPFASDPETFHLRDVREAPLLANKDDVIEVCNAAVKEAEIEVRIGAIADDWKSREFAFGTFKNRGELILKGLETAEIIAALEDSQMALGGLMGSRYMAPFKKEIYLWAQRLSQTSETIELWLQVQGLWQYLEAVFSGGDIARQMPGEAKRFAQIDKSWVKVMTSAGQNPSVIYTCCQDEMVRNLLPYMIEQLELSQKALGGYLEMKRNVFPRFYLVSDPVLLEILAQSSDPNAVQPHLKSVFDNIARVHFAKPKKDEAFSRDIVKMESSEGEVIPLTETVRAEGHVEVWLGNLLQGMRTTVRDILRHGALQVDQLSLSEFISSFPAQVVMVGLQLQWTQICEDALGKAKSDKAALASANRTLASILAELTEMTTQTDLSKRDRTKIEALITVQVHARDVFADLSRSGVRSASDFEWLKQTRFYWRSETDNLVVQVTDVDLPYCYEYLGVSDRLVITPLTDRCYITLAQAIGMHYGGAPAGPAGTGKTETVKDMGRTLGKLVVVLNCSDQMDYRICSKIFKGLAMSGAWGCFDEFNRIELEVLSVVAQQIACVLNAMKERREYFTYVDGQLVPLDSGNGIFITMNPGYAGRQELPENLKALFRSVSMMVPDRQIIMRVKLASQGFQEAVPLSKKFFLLYRLCEEQLSKQRHYDFGLRNILSVLRTAGTAKRAAPDLTESVILFRVLRDMNLSKLVDEDEPLFLSLLNDLFPGLTVDKNVFDRLEGAIAVQVQKQGLVNHPDWNLKILQLYETSLVRHGIMVLGPSGSGKTKCITTLLGALHDVGEPHREIRMNPKAITGTQMFGRLDVATNDWTDGIFSVIWRKACKEPAGGAGGGGGGQQQQQQQQGGSGGAGSAAAAAANKSTWITLDGPVDTIWIENLNSVLDDNKTLTLANGDRIAMAPKLKLVFEVADLDNASPATVSRAGIIYMSATSLGWKPVVEAWLRKSGRPASESSHLQSLFHATVDTVLTFMRDNLEERMRLEDVNKISTTLRILDAMLLEHKRAAQQAGRTLGQVREKEQKNRGSVDGPINNDGADGDNSGDDDDVAAVEESAKQGGNRTDGGEASGGAEVARTQPSGGDATAALLAMGGMDADDHISQLELPREHLSRLFVFALLWGTCSLLETDGRVALQEELMRLGELDLPDPKTLSTGGGGGKRSSSRSQSSDASAEGLLWDFAVNATTGQWEPWAARVPDWSYPRDSTPDFSSILVPTVDIVRMNYLIESLASRGMATMLIGQPGSAKTVTMLRYLESQADEETLFKTLPFSSATTPMIFQRSIEYAVEKRQGRTFGPPGGKRLIVFLDDINMPEINSWGDQPTAEIVRELMEEGGFYDLDKPGEWSVMQDLSFVAAMGHPGGGRNDIPARLKRHFGVFNCTLPSNASLAKIYATILVGHFCRERGFGSAVVELAPDLVELTRVLWVSTKARMLPTPAKVHYVFNMRDLTRITQGLLNAEAEVITGRDSLLSLWKHECDRIFADRFINAEDKDWFAREIRGVVASSFGDETAAAVCADGVYFVDFLRDAPEYIPDGDASAAAEADLPETPHVYEPVESLESLRERVAQFMAQYNETVRGQRLDLVLFDDALIHLTKISRIIAMPRGNALLVGVGGSGKQSLTRLAAFIAGYESFQLTISRTYNVTNLFEDLRYLYKRTGVDGKNVAFIFSDAEIKDEGFLEYVNNILSSGEVANLFAKDELDQMLNDLRPIAKKKFGMSFNDSLDNLYKLFIDRVRANLHVVLCLSPVGDRFRSRTRKFPALISGCTIDWFMPWSRTALLAVATKFVADVNISGRLGIAEDVVAFMAHVHDSIGQTAAEYFAKYRRHVYVTPKSYLSFVKSYIRVYVSKRDGIAKLRGELTAGLDKLVQAGKDIEVMKVELDAKKRDVAEASEKAEEMLGEITVATAAAERKKEEVMGVRDKLAAEAAEIDREKADAEHELEKAKPALAAAEAALQKIKPGDIASLKKLQNPPNLIKRIMDGVLVLRALPVDPARLDAEQLANDRRVLVASWSSSQRMLTDVDFLNRLFNFPRDHMNAETVELLQPYFEMADFNPVAATKVSGSVAGLCEWILAMAEYFAIARMVQPKKERVMHMEEQMAIATAKLAEAQAELDEKQRELDAMQARFDASMARKKELEDLLGLTKRRMDSANALITGLQGERERWTKQVDEFDETVRELVGDVAIATAFMSYAGPFNSEVRAHLTSAVWTKELVQRDIPHAYDLSVNAFLTDAATVGEWNLQGLPTDELSVQNGIIVTTADRYPLLIDPQGQGKMWILNKEKANRLVVTTLNDRMFRTTLENAVETGQPLLIQDVEEELDPCLDNLMEKNHIQLGRLIKVKIGEKEVDYNPRFRLYITTKLPNPHYAPEVFAKSACIDFTVTHSGLEQQLLGRVLLQERAELEEQRQQLLADVNLNTRRVKELEDELLNRLSHTQGNLVDDESLLATLNQTKATAAEVAEKLAVATETEASINKAREEYRPVATRGSIIYFLIAEMSRVNHMYQTSLAQFLDLFDDSMRRADPDRVQSKRIQNVVDYCTLSAYRYISRGLFESHKQLFILQLCLKIDLQRGAIDPHEYSCLIKGGAALDLATCREKIVPWIPDAVWLDLCALAALPKFSNILADIEGDDEAFRKWYDLEAPERSPLPAGYEDRAQDAFTKMLVVRCWRQDRTMVAAVDYIQHSLGPEFVRPMTLSLDDTCREADSTTPIICLLSLGADPSAAIELLAKRSKIQVSAISMGQGQEVRARRLVDAAMHQGKWVLLQNCHLGLKFLAELEVELREHRAVLLARQGRSSGGGRGKGALDADAGVGDGKKDGDGGGDGGPGGGGPGGGGSGTGHGGASMSSVGHSGGGGSSGPSAGSSIIGGGSGGGGSGGGGGGGNDAEFQAVPPGKVHPNFRLWITSEPIDKFPIGLLQMSIKISNEAPKGVRASLLRSLNWVSQEMLDAVETPAWPILLYSICFLHTVVCERRKFGRVGWNIPYEFGHSDLAASVEFTKNYLFLEASSADARKAVSWPTVRYMISQINYGGRVTDDRDRRLLATYGDTYFGDPLLSESFRFAPGYRVPPMIAGVNELRASVDTLPSYDSPEVFGLHANADLAFRNGETRDVLGTILSIQPKDAGLAGGMSREETVLGIVLDLLKKLPSGFTPSLVRRQIAELGGRRIPLNVTLAQEVDRLQRVLVLVRRTLQDLKLAIAGTIIMSESLSSALDSLYDARVPPAWLQVSWPSPTVGTWFTDLTARVQQFSDWLDRGRPRSFWLAGFFNPQGFLTSVRQEVTRAHASEGWALDAAVVRTEVTRQEKEDVKVHPEEGVYVHGLSVEGAGWDKRRSRLVDATPKQLFAPLPCLHVTAVLANEAPKTDKLYTAPVYSNPARGDLSYIFDVHLPIEKDSTPSKWILAGVCLLTSTQ